jgi:hypothetical protein
MFHGRRLWHAYRVSAPGIFSVVGADGRIAWRGVDRAASGGQAPMFHGAATPGQCRFSSPLDESWPSVSSSASLRSA